MTLFRRLFSNIFAGFARKEKALAYDGVGDNELLTRYLLFSDWFRERPAPRVRHEAFMPHPYVELSVNRIDGVSEALIWDAGDAVATKQKKRIYGRGDVNNSVVTGQNLKTVPDEPPPRHANIIGWPTLTGDKKTDKHLQKVKALEIAGKAKLVLNPDRPA